VVVTVKVALDTKWIVPLSSLKGFKHITRGRPHSGRFSFRSRQELDIHVDFKVVIS
jgi:hypothetical protein